LLDREPSGLRKTLSKKREKKRLPLGVVKAIDGPTEWEPEDYQLLVFSRFSVILISVSVIFPRVTV